MLDHRLWWGDTKQRTSGDLRIDLDPRVLWNPVLGKFHSLMDWYATSTLNIRLAAES